MNHGWEKKRLGDICLLLNGFAFKSTEYVGSGVRIIRIANVQDGYISDEAPQFYPESQIKLFEKFLLLANDLLLSLTGNVGRVALLPTEMLPAALNQRVACLRSHCINRKYLYYFLRNRNFIQDCIDASTGIAQLNLSTEWLKTYKILVPPQDEQIFIANELDKINELIKAKLSQLADFDLLAQSLFYEMFGDPIENPKGWPVHNLGDCVEFKNGLNFTPTDKGEEVKCLGVGDFKSDRYISSASLSTIIITESISSDYLLKYGDIIFVRSNGNKALIGRSIMYQSLEEATFSGFCIRCRYNQSEYNSHYMSYFFSSKGVRNYMTSQGKGCNINNINQKILSSIPLIIPPINLQNKFAAKIKLIEDQKKRIESSLADLQTLLASRMDYWFNED